MSARTKDKMVAFPLRIPLSYRQVLDGFTMMAIPSPEEGYDGPLMVPNSLNSALVRLLRNGIEHEATAARANLLRYYQDILIWEKILTWFLANPGIDTVPFSEFPDLAQTIYMKDKQKTEKIFRSQAAAQYAAADDRIVALKTFLDFMEKALETELPPLVHQRDHFSRLW